MTVPEKDDRGNETSGQRGGGPDVDAIVEAGLYFERRYDDLYEDLKLSPNGSKCLYLFARGVLSDAYITARRVLAEAAERRAAGPGEREASDNHGQEDRYEAALRDLMVFAKSEGAPPAGESSREEKA